MQESTKDWEKLRAMLKQPATIPARANDVVYLRGLPAKTADKVVGHVSGSGFPNKELASKAGGPVMGHIHDYLLSVAALLK
jgi:hypothetical protein